MSRHVQTAMSRLELFTTGVINKTFFGEGGDSFPTPESDARRRAPEPREYESLWDPPTIFEISHIYIFYIF